MVRIARIILPKKAHLVSHSSAEGFSAASRRRQLLELATPLVNRSGLKMLGWCVLPKAATYVLVTPDAESLSTFMRLLQTQYTRYVERSSSESQSRKPNRFACAAVDSPSTLDAIKFVESLSCDMPRVKHPSEYAFCSAAVRCKNSDIAEELLTGRSRFTSKVGDWAKFHDEPLDEDYREYIAMRLRTGKPIGSKHFISRIENQLGMNLSRRRGRPSKG